MRKTIAFLGLMIALGSMANAETYYIAPEGKSDGEGTATAPFANLKAALEKAGPGNTFVFKPGFYTGQIALYAKHAGTQERPTILKSEVKWKAVLLGSPGNGVVADKGCDWLVLDGFEVMGARAYGLYLKGKHSIVRNCWVHNNTGVGVGMHEGDGGLIERNLIEYNGCHPQFHHGIYASGANVTIRGNLVRHNSGYGIHCYPNITNARIESNLIQGQRDRFAVLLACPKGGGKNRVVNNTLVENAGGVRIWYGDGEVVANNLFISHREDTSLLYETRNTVLDYNLVSTSSEAKGKNGLTGDPLFTDGSHAIYTLKPDSPAAKGGSSQYAAEFDFFGKPFPAGKPWIGAFGPLPSTTAQKAEAKRYEKWPYFFALNGNIPMPDPWEEVQ